MFDSNLTVPAMKFLDSELLDYTCVVFQTEAIQKFNANGNNLSTFIHDILQFMINVLDTTVQIVEQTGEILLTHFQSPELTSNLKDDQSVVTNADLAADKFISDSLKRNFPNDLILSEELQTTLPSTTSDKDQAIWIVDPLDGTTNFSLGLHIWGVLLTRLVNGYPELAILYFPLTNELYHAQRGKGAYLNGKPIQVEPFDKDRPLPFFACCSRTYRLHDIHIPYKPRILGSAAYSFCCVARGVAVLSFDATPKIWDIAGAWLLLKEAGGAVELFEKHSLFPLEPGIDYAHNNLKILAAPTAEMIAQARKQIIPK
jgi:myo-inositol-1(or 4)-monophosphatase